MSEDAKRPRRGRPPVDVAGQVFGRLTAREAVYLQKGRFWRCDCACGATKYVRAGTLRCGTVKSCGCLWRGPKPKRKT